MPFDAAYEALTDHDDDARWAYGTGFADPLAGVSTAMPDGVDHADLATYCLMLGDDALIMSHRRSTTLSVPDRPGCSKRRPTPNPLPGAAGRYRRCCSPAITVRSRAGAQSSRSSAPGSGVPICSEPRARCPTN